MARRAGVAILISGKGSNMGALLYASRAEDCPYEVVLVASNNPKAPGLALAAAEGVPTFALSHKGMQRQSHDAAMDDAIRASGAQFVALAGYMRILSPEFVAQWAGRLLNIHPSLLPAYKGLETHARAIAAGDSHGGCTVHLVSEDMDSGEVLGQTVVAIMSGDTAEVLSERVLVAEHQLYPRVLAAYVTRETSPEWLVAQVRERAMAMPEAEETLSHGMPCFGIIKGKKFAWVSLDHHGDGRIALLVKISGVDEQVQLMERDPERYFRPAYFGDGWIAIRLDLGNNDWDDIADWIGRSWRSVAPKKLAGLMQVAEAF